MSVSTSTHGGVATILLDRPDQLNAVNVALARGLEKALLAVATDPTVRVVVVRGAGGNFCAGGDFDEVARLRARGEGALLELFVAFRQACAAIATIDVPVIVAVEGIAAAGGFELMQAADIVLVSDDARIKDSHVNFGMIPGGGSTVRLPRIVGRQQALALLLSGDTVSGADAVRLGLAYKAVPAADFDAAVTAFARRLAGRDRAAVTTIKRLVHGGTASDTESRLDAEMYAVVQHIKGAAGEHSVESFHDRNRKGANA